MGLKNKISLIICVLFSALLASLAVVLTRFAEQRFQSNIAAQHGVLAASLSQELDRQIQVRQNALAAAATRLAAEPDGDPSRFQRFVDARVALATLHDELYVLAPDGSLLASHPRVSDQASRVWRVPKDVLPTAASGGVSLSRPLNHPLTGEPMILLISPMRNHAGGIVAYFVGSQILTRDSLFSIIHHTRIGHTGYPLVITRDRIIVAAPDAARLMEQVKPGANAGLDAALAQGRFSGTTETSRGVSALITLVRLKNADWFVSAVWPLEEAYAPVMALRRSMLWATSFLSVMLLLLVWASMGLLSRPLAALRDSMRKMVAHPELQHTLTVSSGDEISEVIVALNELNAARDQAEAKLARMTHLYLMLSQTNEALLRLQTPEALYAQICRIAVAHDRVRMAWIGLTDAATLRVLPVARSGAGTEYLEGIVVSVDPELPQGGGPTGMACRTGRPVICNDFFGDPATVPWRERAHRAGFRASAAFPFKQEERVLGALTLYTDEKGYFDADVAELFREMASDISFALNNFAREVQRRAAEQKLNEAQRVARIGSWAWNKQTGEVEWSEQMFELFGAAPFAFTPLARTLKQRIRPEDVPRYFERLHRALEDRHPFELEFRVCRDDGRVGDVWMLGKVLLDQRGEVSGLAGTLQDVTERKALEAQDRLSAKVFESASEGIIITDANNRIVTANQAFVALSGYSLPELLGQDPRILDSGRNTPDFYRLMWKSINETGAWRGELWNRRRNGDLFPVWLAISVEHDVAGNVAHYIGIFTDITERKLTDERITFLAHNDPLTGLANRSLLHARVELALAMAARGARHAAVLFLDLDRFKTVNDSLGHAVGDSLLQKVAQRIQRCVRDEDTVARLGGDEFVIVLSDLRSAEDAAIVASKILEAHVDPFPLGEFEVNVTPSIGIAVYPDNGGDCQTLLKNADVAMYYAKQKGRNNFQFFTGAMNAFALERLVLSNALRRAVPNRELSLVYQPQMAIDGHCVVGGEALLRWHHPELGGVPPSRFIPIAEEHGLIVSIGEWVLREACRQNRQWQDQGLPKRPVAVNLSALQFRQRNIVELIRDVLSDTGLEARWLELELTESLIMDEAENVIETLRSLKAVGVRLSIDDFGTGYSSLSYLRRFAIDKLKIDRSFVQDATRTADGAAIVKAVIGLAKTLNLCVIAEGVETHEQLHFLSQQGCDEVQGYYFARPMPPEAFAHFIREHMHETL